MWDDGEEIDVSETWKFGYEGEHAAIDVLPLATREQVLGSGLQTPEEIESLKQCHNKYRVFRNCSKS